MNLNNLNITVGEILKNPKAKAILAREFPTLINTPIVKLSQHLRLRQVLQYAKGKVPQDKIQRIVKELEEI